MKNIWLLMKANIKRNKIALFLSVAGGSILCFILYAMGNLVTDKTLSQISIGLIDYDNSALSEDFKGYLTKQLDYKIIENNNYEKLSTELIDKKISVIIEIPEDFYEQFAAGNRSELTITSLEDYENAAFIQAYVNNYMSSISILSAGATEAKESFDKLLVNSTKANIPIIKESAATIDQEELKGHSGFINSIGFYLMITFSISVVLAYMILDDRLTGIFSRIQITPVKPIQYIIGSGIFGIGICILQIAIYCGFIYFNDINTGVPLNILMIMMLLFSIFIVCFSLSIALATKSRNAVTSIIILFSSIGCILGGAYFPLDMSPKALQNVARILPQFWFMDALRKLQDNVHTSIGPHLVILGLFAVLTLLIGAVLFSQNYKNN